MFSFVLTEIKQIKIKPSALELRILFDKVSFVNANSLMYWLFYVFSCYSSEKASKDAQIIEKNIQVIQSSEGLQ